MTQAPNPLRSFKPQDWYWLAKDGRIYSSARNQVVSRTDAGYRAFVAQIGAATPWPVDNKGQQSSVALQELLSFYNLKGPI
jgi:hypothetical protein